MSRWTHITSCLSVDTLIESEDIETTVLEYLASAPKITGSELDADIFVNKQSGYNTWTNEGQYQTCVTISIQGDLRNRTKCQTTREFDAFKRYIEKEYMIRDYSLNIEGD